MKREVKGELSRLICCGGILYDNEKLGDVQSDRIVLECIEMDVHVSDLLYYIVLSCIVYFIV